MAALFERTCRRTVSIQQPVGKIRRPGIAIAGSAILSEEHNDAKTPYLAEGGLVDTLWGYLRWDRNRTEYIVG